MRKYAKEMRANWRGNEGRGKINTVLQLCTFNGRATIRRRRSVAVLNRNSPCSPDSVPKDHFPFPKLKSRSDGRRFDSVEVTRIDVTART